MSTISNLNLPTSDNTSAEAAWVDAHSESDLRLLQADLTLTKAEKTRSGAVEWVSSMEKEIQIRLSDAKHKRKN